MSRVAFLGLGAMGSRMCGHLIEAGHDVVVYNRSAERCEPLVARGARAAATPAEAVRRADIAIAIVTDIEASRAIWLDPESGALASLPEGAVAVDSSTLTPEWMRELGRRAADRGVGFVDAPVAGSRPQADAQQLVFLVGGEDSTVGVVRPLFDVMGRAVLHAGAVGLGTALKLAVNSLFGIQVAAVAETLQSLARQGVPVAKGAEMLAGTPVMSPAANGVAGLMADRNFAPLFPIELVEKDFRYVVESARQFQAETPMAEAARGVYARSIDAGFGADNISGVTQLFDAHPAPGEIS